MPPKKVTPRGKAASSKRKSSRAHAEEAKAKKAASKKSATPSTRGLRYVRNLYGSEARVRLDNGLEMHLRPRGQVGDMVPVDAEDRADQKYALNKNLLFEEISAAEAKKLIEKQNTNAQAPRPDPTLSLLRNEQGQPYEQSEPTIEIPFEEQGTVVANIEEAAAGRFTEKNTQLTRPSGAAPQQVAVPGSAENPVPQVPSNIPPEQAADWLARNADSDTAADQLRGSLRTSVGPVQREIDPAQRRAPVHPDEVGE